MNKKYAPVAIILILSIFNEPLIYLINVNYSINKNFKDNSSIVNIENEIKGSVYIIKVNKETTSVSNSDSVFKIKKMKTDNLLYEHNYYAYNKNFMIFKVSSEKHEGEPLKNLFNYISYFALTVGGKLDGVNPLNNSTRKQIYDYIINHPGCHLREILRFHGFSPHQVSYHLATLERHNYIKKYHYNKYVQYYPLNYNVSNKNLKIKHIFKNKNIINIYKIIKNNEGITQKDIIKITGFHKNTIYKYIKTLNENNAIIKIKNKRVCNLYIDTLYTGRTDFISE